MTSPFRTDLPPGLRTEYFATQETAEALATKYGGEAFLEPSGPGIMNGEPAWFIAFTGKRVPWNAGDLYVYLQNHPTYDPSK
jgi:hypothetical protein